MNSAARGQLAGGPVAGGGLRERRRRRRRRRRDLTGVVVLVQRQERAVPSASRRCPAHGGALSSQEYARTGAPAGARSSGCSRATLAGASNRPQHAPRSPSSCDQATRRFVRLARAAQQLGLPGQRPHGPLLALVVFSRLCGRRREGLRAGRKHVCGAGVPSPCRGLSARSRRSYAGLSSPGLTIKLARASTAAQRLMVGPCRSRGARRRGLGAPGLRSGVARFTDKRL